MREIKFRAWVQKGTCIDTPQEKQMIMSEPFGLESICSYVGNYTNSNASIGGIDVDYLNESKEAILMQCTGLKDKNGVIEIYQDDILENDSNVFTVDFVDGSFRLVHSPTCKAEAEGECLWDYLSRDCIEFYKLVRTGNIHENKELLEGN